MTDTTPTPPVRQPGLALRIALSVVLAVHVLAVFVGPWAMPGEGSQLAGDIAQLLQPYSQALCLDNGYRFFAPDPGPSHLVRYDVELADGTHKKGTFPDINLHSPRLLYHRHFMLSEIMGNLYPGPPGEKPSPIAEAYIRSYARHLAEKFDAVEVKLSLTLHELPSMEQVRDGMTLDDPRLYDDKPLGTFKRSEL